MNELFHGYYATRIYLPFSDLSRRWRRFMERLRGKPSRFTQTTHLPGTSWRRCTQVRSIRIWEPEKKNGNVRPSELGVLSALAAECGVETNLYALSDTRPHCRWSARVALWSGTITESGRE